MSEYAAETRCTKTPLSSLRAAETLGEPDAAEAKSTKYEALPDRLRAIVDSAPPLTADQRSKIADLLVIENESARSDRMSA